MPDRWQQQCQLISTGCRVWGGSGDVIGLPRAPLRTASVGCSVAAASADGTGKCRQSSEGGGGRHTRRGGCLVLIQPVVQRRTGLKHRARWDDATRGRWSDDSGLALHGAHGKIRVVRRDDRQWQWEGEWRTARESGAAFLQPREGERDEAKSGRLD